MHCLSKKRHSQKSSLHSRRFQILRESSFHMTRGGGGGGGSENSKTPGKGGFEKIRGAPKICILQNQQDWGGGGGGGGGGGAPKKIEPLARGVAKISSFEFQYLHPPLVMINELSLT